MGGLEVEGFSGELLEAAWGVENLFWRALGGVLEARSAERRPKRGLRPFRDGRGGQRAAPPGLSA